MSGNEAIGRARLTGAVPVGTEHALPLDTTTGAVQCTLVPGGGPLPFASWKGSGKLTAGANPTIFYAADKGDALDANPVAYPRGVTTSNCKLTVNVSANALIVSQTTFTVYRNGVATALTLAYVAGETGIKHVQAAVPFGADADVYDLRVDNPGNAADAGLTVQFSSDTEFF